MGQCSYEELGELTADPFVDGMVASDEGQYHNHAPMRKARISEAEKAYAFLSLAIHRIRAI